MVDNVQPQEGAIPDTLVNPYHRHLLGGQLLAVASWAKQILEFCTIRSIKIEGTFNPHGHGPQAENKTPSPAVGVIPTRRVSSGFSDQSAPKRARSTPVDPSSGHGSEHAVDTRGLWWCQWVG